MILRLYHLPVDVMLLPSAWVNQAKSRTKIFFQERNKKLTPQDGSVHSLNLKH